MTDLVFRNFTKDLAFGRSFFMKIIRKASTVTDAQGTVSVNLVGPTKMRSLNRQYRHKDAATDVLSFPMGFAPKKKGDYNTERDLGDLFICISEVKRRASAQDKTVKEYMAWATVHGFLHICGYDHERSPKDEIKMFTLEKKILMQLK